MLLSTVRMPKIKKKGIVWDKRSPIFNRRDYIHIDVIFLGNNLAKISKALKCAYSVTQK